MNTKLTLRLDEALIQQAKEYAAREGRSVSDLVSNYFARLTATVDAQLVDSPSVPASRSSSLRGVLAGSALDEADYYQYLERKYQ